MRKIILVLFSIGAILFSNFALAKNICELKYISDGDTIRCKFKGDLISIRLANIDAPETTQAFGLEAKDMLINLIKPNKNVEFEITTKDRYGRIVAEIYTKNKNLNQEMVKLGGAWVYRQYLNKNKANEYLRLEKTAKANKYGLWRANNPVYPSEFRRNKKKKSQENKQFLATKQKNLQSAKNNSYNCVRKTCKQIASCEEAYFLLNQCGFSRLDRDKDGVPCESICR